MSHAEPTSTTRLGIAAAPSRLRLVQDLLNTRDVGGKVPDLLASPDLARDWLIAELARHSAETSSGVDRFDPTEADLDDLAAELPHPIATRTASAVRSVAGAVVGTGRSLIGCGR